MALRPPVNRYLRDEDEQRLGFDADFYPPGSDLYNQQAGQAPVQPPGEAAPSTFSPDQTGEPEVVEPTQPQYTKLTEEPVDTFEQAPDLVDAGPQQPAPTPAAPAHDDPYGLRATGEVSPTDRFKDSANRVSDDLYATFAGKTLQNNAPVVAKSADANAGLKRQLLEAKLAALQAKVKAGGTLDPGEQQILTYVAKALNVPLTEIDKIAGKDAIKLMPQGRHNENVAIRKEVIVEKNKDDERNYGHKTLQDDFKNRMAEAKFNQTQWVQNRIQGQHESDVALRLGEKTAPFAELTTALKKVDSMAPGFLWGEVPPDYALTTWERFKQDFPLQMGKSFSQQQALALRGAMQQVQDLIIRARTGAVINDQEFANYQKFSNDAIAAGPAAMAAVLPLYRQMVGRKLAAIQAPYYQRYGDMWNQMSEMPGWTSFQDPIFADQNGPAAQAPNRSETTPTAPATPQLGAPQQPAVAQPAPAAPPLDVSQPLVEPSPEQLPPLVVPPKKSVGQQAFERTQPKPAPVAGKIRVSNGRQTLEIDQADLADAERDGYKRVGG